ncbi:MAG: protein translocase subunit SecF [Clostridia bacterium]|nr:protein translocase subunit SecF [Clostridia bacterium]MBQ6937860.1 protein translocase subunit SecF [Clostridia bacterium]
MFSPTSKRKIFFSISAILVVLSIVLLFVKGLNFGIDFTGGTTLQFDLDKTKYSVDVENEIRDIVKKHANTNDITIQKTGENGVSVKTIEMTNEQSDKVIEDVKKAYKLEQKHVLANEKVSGTVSGRLIGDSVKAILLAIILMLLYITIRFDFQSGTSAVLALAHDVIIMLGFYALFGFTVNTGFIAAILTIVGYSINATIIVFDRVRENNRMMKKATPDEIADKAITSSYLRAINSSLTTLFTIGVLYVMGVASIKEFALPIIVGIVAGTYSSLFIAGPFWAWWKKK